MDSKKISALILGVCGLVAVSLFMLRSDSTTTAEPNTFRVLGSTDFATHIAKNNVTLIDVRTPEEFAAGHLSGAININSAAPDFAAQLNALDKNGNYAIYCRSGNRSSTALKIMRSQNFVSVVDLEGGIIAWERSSLPVCTNSLTC